MKITVVAPSLECGGTQRAVERLARDWVERGYAVTVITLIDSQQAPDFITLHPGITHKRLDIIPPTANLAMRLLAAPRQIYRLHQELLALRPDVVVSFLDWVNVITSLTLRISKRHISHIASVRSAMARSQERWITRWLACREYRRVDALVVVNPASLESLPSAVLARAVYIGNYIEVPDISLFEKATGTQPSQNFIIGALGRLEHEKGFDILIEAFARIASQNPHWRLHIWGEGSKRPQLEEQIQRLSINSQTSLLGAVKDYRDVLPLCDLFVLPSRFEGFPNALIEAMSCELACIAFDCPGANAAIINHQHNGILVNFDRHIENLAAALSDLINNAEKRETLARNARRSVAERFSPQAILCQWDALFQRVTQAH